MQGPADKAESETEAARIKELYRLKAERGCESGRKDEYERWLEKRYFALLDSTLREGGFDFEQGKMLDIGCGGGGILRLFVEAGAKEENVSGVDLLVERAEAARRLLPKASIVAGSAESLPFPDEHFDCVVFCIVYSSIVSEKVRMSISSETMRVLKKDGFILWSDIYRMGRDDNMRPITKKDLARYFPGCEMRLKKIRLDRRAKKRLAKISMKLVFAADKMPFAPHSHYVGTIRPKR